MPIFFQHPVNENTRLGIWKIEETESFFRDNVPLQREVTHPHKRLQHLAGRFLLRFLFPDFPYELIQIAGSRRPFIEGDPYHFSISHCGDYAAAIVSREERVGIDIEIPVEKIHRLAGKFLSPQELANFEISPNGLLVPTLLWSAKESLFKWYAAGKVDFKKDLLVKEIQEGSQQMPARVNLLSRDMDVHYRHWNELVLTWVTAS